MEEAIKYWEKRVDELWSVEPRLRVVHRACIALGTLHAAASGYQYGLKYRN